MKTNMYVNQHAQISLLEGNILKPMAILGDTGAVSRVERKGVTKVFLVRAKEPPSPELRGCLHDTGATFAPRRVHSGSLSWLYICLHDTTTKSHAGASRPGVSSLRLSHRGENFTPVRNLATVSCKHETATRFGVKSV